MQLLNDLFILFQEYQSSLDSIHSILFSQPNYSPTQIFQAIDHSNKEYIDQADLNAFLINHSIIPNYSAITYFFNINPKALILQDFQHYFPKINNSNQQSPIDAILILVAKYFQLLFQSYIDCNPLKMALANSNIHNLFEQLDIYQIKFIKASSLQEHLSKYNINYSFHQANQIIKYMDFKFQGFIDYNLYVFNISPLQHILQQLSESENLSQVNEDMKQTRKTKQNRQNRQNNDNIQTVSEINKSMNLEKYIFDRSPNFKCRQTISIEKHVRKMSITPSKLNLNKKNPLISDIDVNQNKLFMISQVLTRFIEINQLILAGKEQLISDKHYNSDTLFSILDYDKKQQIGSLELNYFLQNLNCVIERNKIFLLIKRYDLNKDGKLNQQEFQQCFGIFPNQNAIKNQNSKHLPLTLIQIQKIKDYILQSINFEASKDILRQQLLAKNIDLKQIFINLDTDRDGYIDLQSIKNIVQITNSNFNQNQLASLYNEIIVNQENLIQYTAFAHLLYPRSKNK